MALLALPFKAIGWLFKHPKLLIIVVIVIFVIIGIQACNNTFSKSNSVSSAVPVYIKNAPPADKAPYVLQTDSRMYYVYKYLDSKQAVWNGQSLVSGITNLTDYYTYDKKKWIHQTSLLQIDKQYYKYVNLIPRKE